MARNREEGMERRILDSAISVFGERGFDTTTVRQIAAGAGLSAGAIYTYFRNKDVLFQTAVQYGWDSFNRELARLATTEASIERRVAEMLDSGFVALARALPLLRGMLFDASRRQLVEPQLDRLVESIDRLLKRSNGDARSNLGMSNRRRKDLIRIFITGVLFSAALTEKAATEEAIANLRLAVIAFLENYSKIRKQTHHDANAKKQQGGRV